MKRDLEKMGQNRFGAGKVNFIQRIGIVPKILIGFAMILILVMLLGVISYYVQEKIKGEIAFYETGDGSISIPAEEAEGLILYMERNKQVQLIMLVNSLVLALIVCMMIVTIIKRPLAVMLDVLAERMDDVKKDREKGVEGLEEIVNELRLFITGKN